MKKITGPIKYSNSALVSDCKAIAAIVNNFFHSVFTTEDTSTLATAINMFRGTENGKLIIGEISEDDIVKYLRNLDPNKSTGADRLSVRILREYQELVLPLKLLFNKSLQANTLPSHWRCANGTLIKKKM